MPPPARHIVTPAGVIEQPDGTPFAGDEIDAARVALPSLAPHVVSYTLAKGEVVKVLVVYSCHCWTSAHDPAHHAGEVRIMDGSRARVIDLARIEATKELADLIRSLDRHRIYVTAAERNYGAYNAGIVAEDGLAYTAYFTLREGKGRHDGIRHRLRLTVESAYHSAQPEAGSKTSLTAVLSAALEGRTVKYRR